MEKIKNIKYEDLLKDISGKNINEMADILSTKYDLFKEVENIDFFVGIDETVKQILDIPSNLPSIYLFLKKEKMFFNAIELLTNIHTLPKDISIEELNLNLEYAFRMMNLKFNMFYEMVEEGLKMKTQSILTDLVKVFDTKLPNIKELEEIKDGLDNMFKDESPEKLQMIENILSFNDPTMTTIKDAITQVNVNNIQDKLIKDLKK